MALGSCWQQGRGAMWLCNVSSQTPRHPISPHPGQSLLGVFASATLTHMQPWRVRTGHVGVAMIHTSRVSGAAAHVPLARGAGHWAVVAVGVLWARGGDQAGAACGAAAGGTGESFEPEPNPEPQPSSCLDLVRALLQVAQSLHGEQGNERVWGFPVNQLDVGQLVHPPAALCLLPTSPQNLPS